MKQTHSLNLIKGLDEEPDKRARILEKQVHAGGAWLYWIAGVSLLNMIVAFSGGHFHFALGLGMTTFFDEIAVHQTSAVMASTGFLDLLVAVVLAGLGYIAWSGKRWAFGMGILLMTADMVLVLVDPKDQAMSLIFHLIAILGLGLGWQALVQLRKLSPTPN